jgi:hypothetical protein
VEEFLPRARANHRVKGAICPDRATAESLAFNESAFDTRRRTEVLDSDRPETRSVGIRERILIPVATKQPSIERGCAVMLALQRSTEADRRSRPVRARGWEGITKLGKPFGQPRHGVLVRSMPTTHE